MKIIERIFYVIVVFAWTYVLKNSITKMIGNDKITEIAGFICGLSFGMFMIWGIVTFSQYVRTNVYSSKPKDS